VVVEIKRLIYGYIIMRGKHLNLRQSTSARYTSHILGTAIAALFRIIIYHYSLLYFSFISTTFNATGVAASRASLISLWIKSTASDDWGFAIRPSNGLWQDLTALLDQFGEDLGNWTYSPVWPPGSCVYDDGLETETGDVSLLWGENVGFRRRVSRVINSMPVGLLNSRPFIVKGYDAEGLHPAQLVFDFQDKLKEKRGIVHSRPNHRVTTELENSSSWPPRPYKVMRSYYTKAVEEKFEILSLGFRGVATEMALIFLDTREKLLRTWLLHKLDQQSMTVNKYMSGRPISPKPRQKATPA
jgi:hypothetical protein